MLLPTLPLLAAAGLTAFLEPDLLQTPTPMTFDHQHMKLEMVIPEVSEPRFSAVMTLTATPRTPGAAELILDAMPTLTFTSVTVNGKDASFKHENDKLTITLPRPAEADELQIFVIRYDADKPFEAGSGLVFLKGREAREGSRRPASPPLIFSQGQANWNRYWIPCHDWPEEKLSTELIVDVPAGLSVISNGSLVELSQGTRDGERRAKWHWLQAKPHSPYLIMLSVGTFDVANVGISTTARGVMGADGKPLRQWLNMPVYGPPGSGQRLPEIFGNTPAMIEYYSSVFDEPYPWDKYAQVIVRGFRWGGMENTSATVLAEYAASGTRGSQDELIAHELAHQWTGDLVTCNSWNHLWLNEGWATYAEDLWIEKQKGYDAYISHMRGQRARLVGGNNPRAPEATAMVTNTIGDPDAEFTKADNPYSKGGFLLHTLRMRLGDEAFFNGVRSYLNNFKFRTATTDDFRTELEKASGLDLKPYFEQWMMRPGFAKLDVTWSNGATPSEVIVEVAQKQLINDANPSYQIDLPIHLKDSAGKTLGKFVMPISGAQSRMVFTQAEPVGEISVDPDSTVLASLKVRKAGAAKDSDKGASKPSGK